MTDMDSTRTEGGQASPNAVTSQGGDQHNYIDADTFAAFTQKLDRLEKMMGSVQSSKDKSINLLSEQVGDLSQRLARYEELRASGLSPTDAQRQMEIDDLLAERKQGNQVPDQAAKAEKGGTSQAGPGVEVSQVLNVLGLSDTDPEVAELVRQGKTDLQSLFTFAAQRREAQKPKPNPAAIAPAGGGGAAEHDTIESLTAELQTELAKPVKDFKRIKVLQEKQKALLPHE